MPRIRSVAPAGLLLVSAACSGVGTDPGDPPLPVCGSAPAPIATGAGDTLDVVVRVAGNGPAALLVRVDRPGESDIAFPPDAPLGVAAAGLAVGSRGVFQVCAAADPAEIGFRAAAVPHERAWLRVTTRRPVRARLEFDGGAPGAVVRVGPGLSRRSAVVGSTGDGA